MKSAYPCIYVDYINNVWKFFRNSKKELCYKIMYADGKWTKENLIDKNVLEFAVYINEDENIHIVYNNNKRELKYCTMQNKKWMGSIISEITEEDYELYDLKVIVINNIMHIFYIMKDNRGNDHGILTHCIWNGKDIEKAIISHIILAPNINDFYTLSIDDNYNLNIFFMNDEGDEISINHAFYQTNKWSRPQRLYGIQGDNIEIDILTNKDDIHILNKSKDGLMYYLEHVSMNRNNEINEYKVKESNLELSGSILFKENDKIYCTYIEDNNVYYSYFDKEKWSQERKADLDYEGAVKFYNCFIWNEECGCISEINVYGTEGLDLKLFIPNNLVSNKSKYVIKKDSSKESDEDINFKKLKLELTRTKTEKKRLERQIEYLNSLIIKKQDTIKEYAERLSNVLDQKHKSDENYNAFLEVQQNIKKDLLKEKEKCKEEAKIAENYKIEAEQLKIELDEHREIIESLNSNIIEINRELENQKTSKNELKKILNDRENENLSIKKQLETLNETNIQLNKELDLERNQSFMDRLLRKRPNEF